MSGDKKDLNIKILVAYHKPFKIFKNDILVPIHVGRDVAFDKSKDGTISQKDYEWLLKNTIGDNTGDNISKFNRKYCELTAIYWAWKNYEELGNPDYVGLMHYRTFFDFIDYAIKNNIELPPKGFYSTEFLSKILNKYDMIISETLNTKKDFGDNPWSFDKTAKEIWKFSAKYHSELYEMLQIYNNNIHFKNMFILKKENFFKYCELLFSTLSDLEKNDVNGILKGDRVLSYHAEALSSLIFMHLYNKKHLKHLDLPWFIVQDNSDLKNNINLVSLKIKRFLLIKKRKHYEKKIYNLLTYKNNII